MENVKHLVLVHGFCHGAWYWFKLVTLLKLAGHRVTALDLAGGGVNLKQLDEIVSLSDLLQPLIDFMANSLGRDEKVILVGHSYGGLPISLSMETFPEKISGAVFLIAYMPNHKDPPVTLIQEDLELAKMLARPSKFFLEDMAKECPLTEEKYGLVNRDFITGEEDEVGKEEFVQWMIHNIPPKEVKSIKGAGHTVIPKEICICLLEIAEKYH